MGKSRKNSEKTNHMVSLFGVSHKEKRQEEHTINTNYPSIVRKIVTFRIFY
jgi:hypothetical protein